MKDLFLTAVYLKCGLKWLLEDDVLADRGFLIENLTNELIVKLQASIAHEKEAADR